MSTGASTTIVSTPSPLSSLKIDYSPPVYDGNAATFKSWVRLMDTWFRLLNVVDEQTKVDLTLSKVSPEISQLVCSQPDDPTTWDAVKAIIVTRYRNDGILIRAFKRLMNIKQTGTLQQYNDYFTSVYNTVSPDHVTNWVLLDRYINGISAPHVKRALLQSEIDPTKADFLEEAIRYAIQFTADAAFSGSTDKQVTAARKEIPGKGTAKIMAPCITMRQIQDEHLTVFVKNTTTYLPTPLIAILDNQASYNLVSHAIVPWLGYENAVEHGEFDTVYLANGDPLNLTARIMLSIGVYNGKTGLAATAAPEWFYITRLPGLHFILSTDQLRMDSVEMGAETARLHNVPEQDAKEEHIPPHVDYFDKNPPLIVPRQQQPAVPQQGLTVPFRNLFPATPPDPLEGATPADQGATTPTPTEMDQWERIGRVMEKDRRKLKEFGPPETWAQDRNGERVMHPLVIEAYELGWARYDLARPPPLYDPTRKKYVEEIWS